MADPGSPPNVLLNLITFFIHRLLTAIHLPASGTNLIAMAVILMAAVIYYIIETQMETVNSISTTSNSSNVRPGVRFALTFVGIIAAIICLFTLLSEVNNSGDTTVSHLIDASSIVLRDFSVGAIGVNFISAMWPF